MKCGKYMKIIWNTALADILPITLADYIISFNIIFFKYGKYMIISKISDMKKIEIWKIYMIISTMSDNI